MIMAKKIKNWLPETKNLIWYKKPKKNFILRNKRVVWFPDGKINVYYNLIEKHIKKGLGDKKVICLIDKDKIFKFYSYYEIKKLVNNFQNIIFKKKRINKVMIQASSTIDSVVAMLACAKSGIHFSVIFEDLHVEAILKRINIFKPDIFITRVSHNCKKLKKKISLECLTFKKINYFKDTNEKNKIKFVNSDQDLFTLFTSGSTGEPKGITHSTGGYLVYSVFTCIKQFGINRNSNILTASDAGWINGHTYALFGPLSLGAKTLLIEKPIDLIDKALMKKILKINITILYLPVTLIRIMKSLYGKVKFKSRKLITLGSMGEPLAPEIAKWFGETFSNKMSIINTYFQTETGGIIISPKFSDTNKKIPYGSVGRPVSKKIHINKIQHEKKEIKIINSWPGCMKYAVNKKANNKYWDKDGFFNLFDLASKHKNNYFIHGRTDDVINIRGHKISSGEVESVLLEISDIRECSAIAVRDRIAGNILYIYLSSKKNVNKLIEKKIINNFGKYALPKKIIYLKDLPKTKSGKILRRLLRYLSLDLKKKNYGDITTILDLKVIDEIENKLIKLDTNEKC